MIGWSIQSQFLYFNYSGRFQVILRKNQWKFLQKIYSYNNNHFRKLKQGMPVFDRFKEAVKMGDFFNSNQLLRFQGESQYRTITGGIISLGIIVTIIISFANMISDTVNRTIIGYNHSQERYNDPPLSSVTASLQGKFMFAVEVWGHNLSAPNRYFDVKFFQTTSYNGQNYTQVPFPMEMCTRQHWAMLPEVVEKFETIKSSHWLCPKIGTVLNIQGKYSSALYTQTQIHLDICNNSTDPDRPCAPMKEINEYLSEYSYFTFYYVDSVTNPDKPEYITYFLEDRSYIIFDGQSGAEMGMWLKQTQIASDNSIWPFKDTKQDVIYSISFPPMLYPYKVNNGSSLARMFIMKNGATSVYNRQVQKIFVVLSFMGGLIGAMMAAMFFVNMYTSFSYEVALAVHVFKDNNQTKTHKQLKNNASSLANVWSFFQYYTYILVKMFKSDVEWPMMQYIDDCRQEITEQLNIKGLIRRLIFLQYAISYILQDFQLSQMQSEKPILPLDVKELRQKIQAKQDENKNSVKQNRSSLSSNKPLFLEPDVILEIITKKNMSRTEEDATIKGLHQSNLTSNQKLRLSTQKKQSQQDFIINGQDGPVEVKRVKNLKKIRESARMGNSVSKKLLLQISKKPNDQQESYQSIQKEEIFHDPTFKD